MTAITSSTDRAAVFRLGVAWVLLWTALAVHVTDEALTGFLSVYNPTVRALQARFWLRPRHTLGHTVSPVLFARAAPAFYSSPLLLIASIYALLQLSRTRHLPSFQ